jgi:hypothetical protein
LPQGTKTSNLLANLVFWDNEWRLVASLHGQGITYTRLIDDITCSGKTDLSTEQTTDIITALHGMVHRKGLELNCSKQTIARAGERQVTTKLVVNVKTSLTTEQRSAIRAAVHRLQNTPESARTTERYGKYYRQISGKVAYLKQHHPHEAAPLRLILQGLPAPKARSNKNAVQPRRSP